MDGCLKSHTHTLIKTFPQEDISTEVFCLSIADTSPLSFPPGEVQNTGEQREKVEREEEGGGGRGERETDGHVARERKQERRKMSDLMLLCACQDFQSTAAFD